LILSVNGLGLTATRPGLRLRAIRIVLRVAARFPRTVLLFQTTGDEQAILRRGRCGVVIPGVGVDTKRFRPRTPPPPKPPATVVYLGRAVRSKGLVELTAVLRERPVPDLDLRLYCAPDETSPGALSRSELEQVASVTGVTVQPPTDRPEEVLAAAHAAILPSVAGEGVSKFVLEALACGTPVLVSSQSGSAEVIEDGLTGRIFDIRDPLSIEIALRSVVGLSPEAEAEERSACRSVAERRFSLEVILPQVVRLHRELAKCRVRA
jgi:glycosyltransferase involved in cell wall biosynthesis